MIARVSITIIVLAFLAALPSSAHSHAYHPGATEPITRAPGLKLAPIGKFRYPTYVTSEPQSASRLYVVEQEGRVRIRDGGTTLPRPFLDISDLVRYSARETERGLFSIAFAPDYATSRLFYVAYSQNDGDIRVDELRRGPRNPTRATRTGRRKVIELEHSEYATHYGGQLQFGPDGYLYLSTGDGGGHGSLLDPLGTGQRLKNLLGKLLRIDPRRPTDTRGYSVPRTNPFFGPNGRRDEIWAYGLRNPWRFSFDASGNLWLVDVGAKSREEVNFSPSPARGRGFNFGWSCYEGTIKIGSCTAPGHDPPLYQYSHAGASCSITGGYVSRDPTLPSLRGQYLHGDYCTGALHALRRTTAGRVANRPLGLVVPRLTTFGQDTAGRLYVASRRGTVYELRAATR